MSIEEPLMWCADLAASVKKTDVVADASKADKPLAPAWTSGAIQLATHGARCCNLALAQSRYKRLVTVISR